MTSVLLATALAESHLFPLALGRWRGSNSGGGLGAQVLRVGVPCADPKPLVLAGQRSLSLISEAPTPLTYQGPTQNLPRESILFGACRLFLASIFSI